MKIHIIGTVNGQLDEGMRNVATHLAKAFEENHSVRYSGLRDVGSIIASSVSCDVTMIFARANKQVYWLSRIVGLFSRCVWLVCVQRPDSDFIRLVCNSPLKASYLAIDEKDLAQIVVRPGFSKERFDLGIDAEKFHPTDEARRKRLKEKHGFSQDKPLVLHVGHCSCGRGLEDFACITDAEKLVVASGMFESADTVRVLEENGIRIIRGYVERIEEFYQMADVYVFPTRSAEHVISIPLSVMEALSCGVPVIGYREFSGFSAIAARDGGITLIGRSAELNGAVRCVVRGKCGKSLLQSPKTWQQAAQDVLNVIRGTQV